MASSGSIWVSLGLKTDQFSKGVSSARGQMKGFKKQTSTLQNSMKGLGAAMAGAFAFSSVKSFFSSSLDAYDEQIQAQKKLENALGFSSTALMNQASALQQTTRFGDEATLQMQAQLATLGLTEDQIHKLTPLVQDLSAQTGKSLAKSAKEVTSALSTGSTTLAKYGVELLGSNTMAENFDLTVQGLSESVGGAAEKMAGEGKGGVIQLENAYGDLKESIGRVVSEGLTELTPALLEASNAMKAIADDETLQWWEKLGATLATGAAPAMQQFNAALTSGVDQAKTLGGAVNNTKQTLIALKSSFDSGKITLDQYLDASKKVTDAAKNKVATFGALKTTSQKVTSEVKVLTKSEAEAAEKARRLADGLKEIKIEGTGLGTRTSKGVDAISGMVDDAQKDLDKGKPLLIPITPKLEPISPETGEEINGNMIKIGEKAGQVMAGAIEGAVMIGFSAIGEGLAGGDLSAIGDSLIMSMSGLLSSFGQQMIVLGLGMEALKESLSLGPFGAAIAIAGGIALIAIGAAIKSSLSDSSTTAFANGGIVSGPTMGLVGEYQGARNNPEVIAPLDRLQGMLDGGGGMMGEVKFRIEGNQLVGILKREDKNNRYSR
jgi:hypothetical protein